jgi:predicted O-methyltransferase YrrM
VENKLSGHEENSIMVRKFSQKCYRALRYLWNCCRNRAFITGALESEHRHFLEIGGFYSPLPDIREIQRSSNRLFDQSHRSLYGLDLREDHQRQLAKKLGRFHADFPFPQKPTGRFRFYCDNSYFSYGDSVILYGMLREFRPKRVIEIGSGFSTALIQDVDEHFLDGDLLLTCIEPFPERLESLLDAGDLPNLTLICKRVQEAEFGLFEQLEENDILFIDSSHVVKIGSDVLHLAFEILPRLKEGVLVHIHDIFWPFEYPKSWLEAGRAWNEAYFIRSYLQNNRSYEILFFNSLMELHHPDVMRDYLPLVFERPSDPMTASSSSLWLRKTS